MNRKGYILTECHAVNKQMSFRYRKMFEILF